MIGRLFITIVMALLIASSAFAGTVTNWELVYEHDSQGVKTSGDISALIAAVKSGADIKVISHSPWSGDWNTPLNRVYVDLSNSIVTGLYDELHPNSIDYQNATSFYHRLTIFSTTGEQIIKYLEASNLNQTVRQPLSWYVNR